MGGEGDGQGPASPSLGVGHGCAAGTRSRRDADPLFQLEMNHRGLRTTRKSRAAPEGQMLTKPEFGQQLAEAVQSH